MKKLNIIYLHLANKKGAVAVYTALVLMVLLGFGALAVDVGHLYGVRNELNNAADAGALAGASVLLDNQGNATLTTISPAKAEAKRVGESNPTGNTMVSIDQNADVQVGHWSFKTRTFTKNEVPDPSLPNNWWVNKSSEELDQDINFINAVKVTPKRDGTPSFLARVLRLESFVVNSKAVAYIGFAGELFPGELDMPIAICKDAIVNDDAVTCNVGRMLNSGGNASTSMTAMWTNFTQPCETASGDTMQKLTDKCEGNNESTVLFGQGIGTQNGVQDKILRNVETCWENNADSDDDNIPDKFWPLTLPVVECGSSNTCAALVGAVNVNVVWIQRDNDPHYNDVPVKMEGWENKASDGFTRWKSFVDYFHLQNLNGPPVTEADYAALYQKKNIYFMPSCELVEPIGGTGGQNFGIRAEIPVLVE
ncbi:MAG: hypothetical protein GX087_03340 [Desulfobulbaceae bacterium]|nr:hypothetical protein [Desulfobulbaceae bacterium]